MAVLRWFKGIFDDASGTRVRALVRLAVVVAGAFGLKLDADQLAGVLIALEVVLQGGVASPIGNQG